MNMSVLQIDTFLSYNSQVSLIPSYYFKVVCACCLAILETKNRLDVVSFLIRTDTQKSEQNHVLNDLDLKDDGRGRLS